MRNFQTICRQSRRLGDEAGLAHEIPVEGDVPGRAQGHVKIELRGGVDPDLALETEEGGKGHVREIEIAAEETERSRIKNRKLEKSTAEKSLLLSISDVSSRSRG